MVMTTVSLEKAKEQLDQLIERARAGEEIVITGGSKPDVRLQVVADKTRMVESVQLRERRVRSFGMLKGKMAAPPDAAFFDPLPDGELKLWWGEDA
jgi:prevent-host-death family protein